MNDFDHRQEAASIAAAGPAKARPVFRILAAVAAPFFIFAAVFAIWEQINAGGPSSILSIVLIVALVALFIEVAVTGRAVLLLDSRKAALACLVLMLAALSLDAFIDGQQVKAVLLLATACQIAFFVKSAGRQKHAANSSSSAGKLDAK